MFSVSEREDLWVLVSPCGSLEEALGNLSDHIALLHGEKLLWIKHTHKNKETVCL